MRHHEANRSLKAFISYKSADRSFVECVVDQFPSWLRHWIDQRELIVGDDLKSSFRQAIQEDCDFLIVFVSEEAAQSSWVQFEVRSGQERQEELSRTFVLPVLLNCPSDRLESLDLDGKNAICVNGVDTKAAKAAAKQLVEHITVHCAKVVERQRASELPKQYLFAAYVSLLVASAAGGSKTMSLAGPLVAAVTVLAYAFTFLILDCVNQLYGPREAQKFIIPGVFSLFLGSGLMFLFVQVPPAADFRHQEAYALILLPPLRMVVAGLTAFCVGQTCDIFIFNYIRRLPAGLNNVISTLVSHLVDTAVFVPLAFWDLHGRGLAELWPIMCGQFVVKSAIALTVSWPAFLSLTHLLRKPHFIPPL